MDLDKELIEDMCKKMKWIGKNEIINDAAQVGDEFLMKANEDEQAANYLFDKKLYDQSAYFYMQAMEKYVKGYICKRINVMNEHMSSVMNDLGHSLDKAIELFIEIQSGNDEIRKRQIREMLCQRVLMDIHFSHYHNSVRYPYFSKGKCRVTRMRVNDCELMANILIQLKRYIDEMYIYC